MRRPSYRHAIMWLAYNDDCEWLNDNPSIESVSTALVADLFGVSVESVSSDLRKALMKIHRGGGDVG